MQDLLEVQGQDEDHRRHHREGDQAAQIAPRHRAAAQHRERDQRLGRPGLDGHEGRQEQDARDQGDDDVRAREAVVRRRREGVDQGQESCRDRDRAGDVQARAVRGAGLGEQGGGQREDQHREQSEQGHRRAPAESVGQDTARHHADGEAEREQGAGDAERAVAGRALRERGGEQAHPGRYDRRRAQTLQRPARQERRRVPGEGRQQRGRAEQGEAGEEQPAAAVEVADAAEQQQEAAGRQRERGDRPLETGLAHAEVGAERGQRHVENGEVKGDHELGRAEDEEDEFVAGRKAGFAEGFVDGSGGVGRHVSSFPAPE